MPTSANIWKIFLKVELSDLICDKRRSFFSSEASPARQRTRCKEYSLHILSTASLIMLFHLSVSKFTIVFCSCMIWIYVSPSISTFCTPTWAEILAQYSHYYIYDVMFPPSLCPGKSSDSQNALEDLAHYEFLAHLRKAATSVSHLDHLNHNGTAGYHPESTADDLPPAIWSPGAQHHSPEGTGQVTVRIKYIINVIYSFRNYVTLMPLATCSAHQIWCEMSLRA